MQAIETRYCGPTDYKGSRIIATSADGMRHVIPYPHELNSTDGHRKAATELCELMGWIGKAYPNRRLVGAPNRRAGYSYVLVDKEGNEL